MVKALSLAIAIKHNGDDETTMGSGHDFMVKTKYHNMGQSDQMLGTPPPPVEEPAANTGSVIDLPSITEIHADEIGLLKAIDQRRSVRDYKRTPLKLDELSLLLWCTQGVRETFPGATLRTVPSAGARHAFETYLLINNVEGLQPGLYRFLAVEHQLVLLSSSEHLAARITEGCFGQGFILTSAATFIWTAVPYRMCWRYGERGYRYLHLDAGHVCQNLYLAAQAVNCGVCAIAAFDDDSLNRTLDVDGEEQFAIYVATVGKVV